jgi:estrogen-related receptor beta like 1
LQFLSEELNRLKKKVDGEASSVSDTSPLVEIRAAIQHLRKENKELDVLLGVLDNELTQARINDVNPKEHNPSNDESEDDSSLDDD